MRGFWSRQQTALFDVRIVDTDAKTYRAKDPHAVLASHQQRKKRKYLGTCQEARRSFTPLVYSVDGLMSAETQAAIKPLASLLSTKWNKPYSEVCGYVRSRQMLALVRTTHLCLRGARDTSDQQLRPRWKGGAVVTLSN